MNIEDHILDISEEEEKEKIDQLVSFGCTKLQAKIYLATCILGPSSVKEIMGHCEMHKVEVYRVLYELEKNSILDRILGHPVRFKCKPPREVLSAMILPHIKNLSKINLKNIYCVSNIKASKKTLEDLIFSLRVCKHVKSNSIVLAKNKQTIGIGAGQMSRIDATKLSLMKTSNHKKKIGFVAASDAFFPFTDNLKLLIKNNCKSVIQPKGSVNDDKTIKCANSYGLPLYFSNYRFFRH